MLLQLTALIVGLIGIVALSLPHHRSSLHRPFQLGSGAQK